MNLERLPEKLLRWCVTVVGILGALYLAKSVGDGKIGFVSLVLVLGTIGMVTLFAKERIWVAVPIAWGLSGSIPALEIPFGVKDLVTLWVFGAFLVFAAFKIVRRKPNIGLPDFLLYAMVVMLVAAFVRNPVGVDALQSERVGGRPYFNVFIAGLAYFVLRKASLAPKNANASLNALTGSRLFDGIAAQFFAWIPALGSFFAFAYSTDYFSILNGEARVNPASPVYVESTERVGYLAGIGQPLLLYLAIRYPLVAILDPRRPWRFFLFIGAIACVLLSGFRSSIILCGAYFVLAGYFHRGRAEVLRIALAGFLALVVIIIGQGRLFDLPSSAQRALSFLPGEWDEFAVLDAKGSTRWRTEMWDIMLNTNLYIDDHLLGDGFGFKRQDLDRMRWAAMYGAGGGSQEDFMVMGAVHSGPVSAIRYVGYVGLALHLAILISLAILGWRLCRQAQGTPYRHLAFFICIPVILEPAFFVFIFGAYENSAPLVLFSLGMMRMLENSLNAHATAAQLAPPAVPELGRLAPQLTDNLA